VGISKEEGVKMSEYGLTAEEQRTMYTDFDREDVAFLCRALKNLRISLWMHGIQADAMKAMEDTAERIKDRHEKEE